jgi:hypothetical protein
MGKSCPLHVAQPFGAKLKLKILISDKNGSAIVATPIYYLRWLSFSGAHEYIDNQLKSGW